MARDRNDCRTPDLFERPLVPLGQPRAYPSEAIRGRCLRDRISQGVAASLAEASLSRTEIAAGMAAYLGEAVPESCLDSYASQAKVAHTISYLRLVALARTLDDTRLLNLGAAELCHAVVPVRVLPWIAVGQLAEQRREVERRLEVARRATRRQP